MAHVRARCGICQVVEPLGLVHVLVKGNERSPRARRSSRQKPLGERLWVRVLGPWYDANLTSEDCWPWIGGTGGFAYGKIHAGGGRGRSTTGPHRAALLVLDEALFLPELRPDRSDLVACHRCDTPLCCNPAHLFWGTYAQNTRDMAVKGRGWWQKPTFSGAKMRDYYEREAIEAEALEAALQAV